MMKITIIDPAPDEEDEIIVKCRFIDNDLTGALVIKNLGNAFEYDDYSVNQAQILDASARYNIYDLYKK